MKPGFLPPGFLAIDLAKALHLKLYDGAGIAIDTKGGLPSEGRGAATEQPTRNIRRSPSRPMAGRT